MFRIGVVTPRYSRDIVGGSEAVMAEAARALVRRGHAVDLFTTCALSHVSWENVLAPGEFVDEGVRVQRFRAVTGNARFLAASLERRVQRGEQLSAQDELTWLNGRLRVPGLYYALLARAESYDAVLLSPYLFWTTIYGAAATPGRAILVPCLHDEAYARLAIVRTALESAAGTWYLSEPEHELARRVAPGLRAHQRVVGAAVEVPSGYDPEGFRIRHGLARPFVFYAGRREEGKGWDGLLADFAGLVAGGGPDVDLVSVGSGTVTIPPALAGRVHDLGFLPTAELPSAYAAALCLVQPSVNESFSRSVMEAFLARTPVLATSQGAVVAWHLARSGAGRTYAGRDELAASIGALLSDRHERDRLGEAGRRYVLDNYTWDHVADAMESALSAFARQGR